uniref:RING-type domain-containing protein n=1 Tax=Varanus komodoensis TaxID=61221 RepID=A0A8D2JH95_VARKO
MALASPFTEMKQEATCPICLEYLKFPKNLDCGHNFCAGCITSYCEKWEKYGEGLKCPICKAPVQKYNSRPNRQLANPVENIQVMPMSLQKESTKGKDPVQRGRHKPGQAPCPHPHPRKLGQAVFRVPPWVRLQ